MRAIYLSIATWAFAETLRIFLGAAYEFTRGDLGLSVPSLYGHVRPIAYYYTFLGSAVLGLLLVYIMLKSPVGYFMRAVRDDFHPCTSRWRSIPRGSSCSLSWLRAPWPVLPGGSTPTTC